MTERTPSTPPVILPLPPNTRRPLFSVMIPSYNCLPYLRSTLQSVLQQDMGPEKMQIEVVDDCSTDGDLKKLVEELGQGRVQYFKQPVNRGSLRNFETCINRATGHFVHLLHGDDRVKPGFYQAIETLFDAFPSAGSAITDYNWVNEDDVETKTNKPILTAPGLIPNWLERIATRQLLQPPAVVVRRSVYEAFGSFYAVHYGEDWEMWIRIAAHYDVAYVPECLATYRGGHSTNISSQSVLSGKNIDDLKKVIALAQAHFPEAKRAAIGNAARKAFSNSFAKSAYRVCAAKGPSAQTQQLAKSALKLHVNTRTVFWLLRYQVARLMAR